MKVIEDIMKEVDMEILRQAPHAQRKYNKITESLRLRFLAKIFQENKSIKKAAEELNINYSSAKTILTMHRKKSRSTNDLAGLGNNNNNNLFGNTVLTLEHEGFASPSVPRSLPPKHLMKPSFMSTASNLSEKQENEDSNSNEHLHNVTLNHTQNINCNPSNIQNNSVTPIIRNILMNNPSIPLSASSPNLQQLNNLALLNQLNSSNNNNNCNSNSLNNLQFPLNINPNNNPFQLPEQQQQILPSIQQQLLPVVSTQNSIPQNQNILLQIQQQIQAQQQQQQMQNTLQQLILLQSAMLAQSTVPQQQQTQQFQQPQPLQEATNNNSNPLAQLLLQQQLLMLKNTNNNTQPQLQQQSASLQLPGQWI